MDSFIAGGGAKLHEYECQQLKWMFVLNKIDYALGVLFRKFQHSIVVLSQVRVEVCRVLPVT